MFIGMCSLSTFCALTTEIWDGNLGINLLIQTVSEFSNWQEGYCKEEDYDRFNMKGVIYT